MAITWLHLSDLHRGQPGDSRWTVSKQPFLDDLETQAAQLGVPDIVFFTGDLAFAGTDQEYERVDETLDAIFDRIGGAPLLVPVPGNHDLLRPDQNDLAAIACERYFSDPRCRRGFLDTLASTQAYFRSLFAGYERWWERRVRPIWDSRRLAYQHGRLVGDFLLTLEGSDLCLGVAGLNSSFLHQRDTDENSLAVEFEQLGPYTDVPQWHQDHDCTLLLMHHPKEWLYRDSRDAFLEQIYPPDSFTACLFGHMHQNLAEIVTGGGHTRRWLQGSSLFGLEHYGRGAEQRRTGYSWGRVERVDDTNGILTRWPRLAARGENRALTIVDGHVSPYPQQLPFPLRKKKGRTSSRVRVGVVASHIEFPWCQADLPRRIREIRARVACTTIDADRVTSYDGGEFDLVVAIAGATFGSGALEQALKAQKSLIVRAQKLDADLLRSHPHGFHQVSTLVNGRRDATPFESTADILAAVRKRIEQDAPHIQITTQLPVDIPAMVGYVLSDLEERRKEAHALFANGQFDLACTAYMSLHEKATLLHNADPANRALSGWVERSALNVGASYLSLREGEVARDWIIGVDAEPLSFEARIILAKGLINVRELDAARKVLELIPESARHEVLQLIELALGRVPPDLLHRLELLVPAAQLLVAEHKYKTALQWLLAARAETHFELGALAIAETAMYLLETWVWAESPGESLSAEESASLVALLEALVYRQLPTTLPKPLVVRWLELAAGYSIRVDDVKQYSRARAELQALGQPPTVDEALDTAVEKADRGALSEALEILAREHHAWRPRLRRVAVLTSIGDRQSAIDEALSLAADLPGNALVEYEATRQLQREGRFAESMPHAKAAFDALPGCPRAGWLMT